MKFPTPWGHGPGAANGEHWVWCYAPSTQASYDSPPEQEDTRMFTAPPEVAELVVRAVNSNPLLIDVLQRCVEWMPCATVRSWPPGFELRDRALQLAKVALAKALPTPTSGEKP